MTDGDASFDSDPFQLFDLPAIFDLNTSALKRAWLSASARLHPDRIADPLERADAAATLARLNDARTILEDDERRAVALLERLGGCQDSSLPDGFLIAMMDIRESMEHADAAERVRLEAWALGQRAEHIVRTRELFKNAGDSPDENQRRAIRIELNAWRYIERMIEQLDPGHKPIM